MAPVKIAALALALVTPLPAAAQGVATWRSFMAEASSRFGVPIAWIERVMRIESKGRTQIGGQPIMSPAGAMGLMQLMPATWAAMRDLAGLGRDPFDPHDNIVAGTIYLRLLYERFGYPGLLAAYNAGPGRYGDYLAGRRPLPGETVRYLATAAPALAVAPAITPRREGLFVVLAQPTGAVVAASPTVLVPSLFAIPPR